MDSSFWHQLNLKTNFGLIFDDDDDDKKSIFTFFGKRENNQSYLLNS